VSGEYQHVSVLTATVAMVIALAIVGVGAVIAARTSTARS
jgi:hypothetical protein